MQIYTHVSEDRWRGWWQSYKIALLTNNNFKRAKELMDAKDLFQQAREAHSAGDFEKGCLQIDNQKGANR